MSNLVSVIVSSLYLVLFLPYIFVIGAVEKIYETINNILEYRNKVYKRRQHHTILPGYAHEQRNIGKLEIHFY